MDNIHTAIAENIRRIGARIAEAAQSSGRKPEDIKLICVTKNFPPEMIRAALACGIEAIGENRVQELLDKYDQVVPEEWHLIGHLQTNKVKYVVGKADVIQSVDSVRLLDEIERRSREKEIISRVMLQINTSGEATKFGTSRDGVFELIERAQTLKYVKVCGVMTIAPLCDDVFTKRLHFEDTHRIYLDIKEKKYDNISMEYLSMGMSGDYEEAILAGSNMVRIGTGIFGARN